MPTNEELDAEIIEIQERINVLQRERDNLAAIIASEPHLPARLPKRRRRNPNQETAQRVFAAQSRRNEENIHCACVGVTAYKVHDPDPNAVNNGNILGINIDVEISGKVIDSHHVLLNWKGEGEDRLFKVHKHTIPPAIPLEQLANKWLPQHAHEADEDPEQDLVKFGQTLRSELVSLYLRLEAMDNLREEAGLLTVRAEDEQDTSLANAGQVLNAFMSDDEGELAEEESNDGSVKLLTIENDAAAREIIVTWSNHRKLVCKIDKNGRIVRASCRKRNGTRDTATARKAMGGMTGLVRRLNA